MFKGFTQETQDFYWELCFNNERPWFQAHKEQYDRCLGEPFKALAKETFALMQESFPETELDIHISRIYRDARRLFGRGPYKENLWFSIKNKNMDHETASFYFDLSAREYSYGMGLYCSVPSDMESFRASIDANPARFERLAKKISGMKEFTLSGEEYKRPKGDHGETVNAWYNRKWVSLESHHEFGGDLFREDLPEILVSEFKKLMPMYEYLNRFCTGSSDNR